MKTYITLRSTLSNASWIQRGAAALLMVALMFTLALALRPNAHMPASTSPVRQAAPAVLSPTMPVIGTGSAYDGGAYVTERPVVLSPTMPVIGTGSAYDGQ
jgi:hypothetical protein